MGQACFKDPQYTTSHPDEACPIFSRECSHAVSKRCLVAVVQSRLCPDDILFFGSPLKRGEVISFIS
jgi:hypothetical protein